MYPYGPSKRYDEAQKRYDEAKKKGYVDMAAITTLQEYPDIGILRDDLFYLLHINNGKPVYVLDVNRDLTPQLISKVEEWVGYAFGESTMRFDEGQYWDEECQHRENLGRAAKVTFQAVRGRNGQPGYRVVPNQAVKELCEKKRKMRF